MPNWLRKVVHGLAPAAGAAFGIVTDAIAKGEVNVRSVVAGAVGAFFGYIVKKARPANK